MDVKKWSEGVEVTDGVWAGIPNEVYHRLPHASSSQLRRLERSAAHMMAPSEPTQAMAFGSAVHAAVLEEDLFEQTYYVKDWDGRTKEGKARSEEVAHMTELRPGEWDAVHGIVEALKADVNASKYLYGVEGLPELSMVGGGMRCRFDRYLTRHGIGVDLKTTQDARPEAFARDAAKYGYHMQAYHYMRAHEAATGAPLKAFVFVAVEKVHPYGIGIYYFGPQTMQVAEEKHAGLLTKFSAAVNLQEFACYDTTPQELELPAWALR